MADQGPDVIECTAAQGWDGIAAALARAAVRAGAAPGAGVLVRLGAGDYRGTTPLAVPAGVTLAGDPGARLIWAGAGSALTLTGVAGAAVEGLAIEVEAGLHPEPAPEWGYEALILLADCTGVGVTGCTLSGGGDHRHGVAVRRSRGVRVADCRVSGCRSGIIFHSSRGRVEGNDCCANRRIGIRLARDQKSAGDPSQVDLRANRCHDNQLGGIVFFSSQGRAEGNDCWGNGLHGICVHHDQNSADHPSKASLTANRCHDNQMDGIGFLSSQGRAQGNDCWSNGGSGIGLRRASDSLPPSEADLSDNHCDHNLESGIAFLAANGHCEGNRCWGNRGGNGIAGQRWDAWNFFRPVADSAVTQGRHDTEPPDPAESAARRRGRRLDLALVEALAAVPDAPAGGGGDPEALADFLMSGCADCFTRFWFGPRPPGPAAAGSAPETGPADAVPTGEAGATEAQVYRLDRVPERPDDHRIELRRLSALPPGPADGAADLPRTVPVSLPLSPFFAALARAWLAGEAPCWSLALVCADAAALESELARLRRTAPERLRSLTRIARQAGSAPAAKVRDRPPRLSLLELDATGRTGEGLRAHLERAMLAPRQPWPPAEEGGALRRGLRWVGTLAGALVRPLTGLGGPRGTEQWREIWWLRAGTALVLLALALGLGALLVWTLADQTGVDALGILLDGKGPAAPGPGPALAGAPERLAALADALWAGWRGLDWEKQAGGFLMLVLALWAWVETLNRFLPRALRLRFPGSGMIAEQAWDDLLDRFVGLPRRLVESPLGRRLGAFLDRLEQAAGRRWLRHRLFGGPLGRPDLALLVLRGQGALDAADLDWLRALPGLRRRGQGLLVLTQVGDLSSLPAAWLCQVLGEAAAPGAASPWDRALVAQDTASAAIFPPPVVVVHPDAPRESPAPDAGPPGGERVALNQLAEVLGCAGDDADRETWANALAHPGWTPLDLLPVLVVGSTPAVQLILTRQAVKDWHQYGTDWLREERPYRALFDGPGHQGRCDDDAVREVFARAAPGPGILTERTSGRPPTWDRLIGQSGRRVQVAAALRGWIGPGATAYLARLTGSGELYNLLRCIESLTGEPLGAPLWRDLDLERCGFAPAGPDGRGAGRPAARGLELPLHLEAALYLLAERLAWGAAAAAAGVDLADSLGLTLDLAWQALGEALDAPPPAGLWPGPRGEGVDEAGLRADGARLYCAYLGGLARLEQAHPGETAGRARLTDLLADLAAALEGGPAPATGAAPGVRAGFLAECRIMAEVLRTLERAPAAALLEQRLRQDWSRLPASVKDLLRTRCLDPGGRVLSALAAAPDEAAVLAIARRYAQRPDLVVVALAALALRHRRRALEPGAPPTPAPDLAAIGRQLIRLHRRLVPAAPDPAPVPPDPLPPLIPPPGPEPADNPLAAALMADPGFIDRLGAVLAVGEAARRSVRERVDAMGRIDLEGLALGPHLPATRIMDEIRLRAGAGAAG
ncbi:right-handed parallel beta-helix repeat-containing protein [uncultured Thiodictyon sp.]|uniref:right-handed parallel beta-helix repeat-containing protein n=1 Tax=uncultured Thiodictyon sp. TaxID=1846217 RepID=UPI0026005739|nr:right-handed parallel beta-helix repeat-containing protein [uncultured Thiodictyon sp.]